MPQQTRVYADAGEGDQRYSGQRCSTGATSWYASKSVGRMGKSAEECKTRRNLVRSSVQYCFHPPQHFLFHLSWRNMSLSGTAGPDAICRFCWCCSVSILRTELPRSRQNCLLTPPLLTPLLLDIPTVRAFPHY